VVVNVRGLPVRFADTHLQHNNNLEREAQAKAIVELLSDAKEPVILVGDLNAIPGTPEITTITNVYTDSWAAIGKGPGYTFAYPEPDRRIDYVLASDDVRFRTAKVLLTPASDHQPYVVGLTVNPRR
jgi:endonuclease/exonuclease/phosphatase family metal-dependent hydrolase